MSTVVIHERATLQAAFCNLADAAETFSLVSGRLGSATGPACDVRDALLRNVHKLERVITAAEGSDPALLEVLHRRSVLRCCASGAGGVRANLAHFHHGERTTTLLSSAPFPYHGFGSSIDLAVQIEHGRFENNTAVFDLMLEDARRHVWVPYASELISGDEFPEGARVQPRPLARVSTGSLRDLEFVRGASEVAHLRGRLIQELTAGAKRVEAHVPGRPLLDGALYWHPELGIWAAFSEWEGRYVHAFGTSSPDDATDLELVVEVNVPFEGEDARITGDFVTEPQTGRTFLTHRGRLDRRRGASLAAFWQHAHVASAAVGRGDGMSTRIALVCELGSPRLVENVAAFVHEVARIKQTLADPNDPEPTDERPEEATGFLDLETREEQVDLVWRLLLGGGALEKHDAIKTAAYSLRDEGLASFQRLATRGDLYHAIQQAINHGVREGSFDRPRRGHIRAILPDAKHYTREVWERCLLSALPAETVSRDDAVHLAAEWARDYLGLHFSRIRREGHIDRGVRSAIRTLICRGHVAAEGRDIIWQRMTTEA